MRRPAWLHGTLGLTSGQRWSAPIVLGVPLLIVCVGLPVQRTTPIADRPGLAVVGDPAPAGPDGTTPAAPAVATGTGPTAAAAPAPAPATGASAPVRPAAPTAPAAATPVRGTAPPPAPAGQQPPASTPSGAPPPPDAPPPMVLLADATTTPGRGDAEMAQLYAAERGLDAAVVSGDLSDPAICEQIEPGSLVVTSLGASGEARTCLAATAAAVIGYDDLAGTSSTMSTTTVSTAPGLTTSLVALVTSAASAGSLGSTVGIVHAEDLTTAVDDAVAELDGRGIAIAATQAVGSDPSAVTQGVLAFSEAGVDTVVFAVDVDAQQVWVNQSALLLPGVAYLVADAADAITEERNAPAFDGALAYTSIRMGWSVREFGETDQQTACRESFEAASVPPTTLSQTELRRAYAWCQHLGLAVQLQDALRSMDLADALAGLEMASPITADLKLHDDATTWGPADRTLLRWTADCSCWQPATEGRP